MRLPYATHLDAPHHSRHTVRIQQEVEEKSEADSLPLRSDRTNRIALGHELILPGPTRFRRVPCINWHKRSNGEEMSFLPRTPKPEHTLATIP